MDKSNQVRCERLRQTVIPCLAACAVLLVGVALWFSIAWKHEIAPSAEASTAEIATVKSIIEAANKECPAAILYFTSDSQIAEGQLCLATRQLPSDDRTNVTFQIHGTFRVHTNLVLRFPR